jgi:hypothetical protein
MHEEGDVMIMAMAIVNVNFAHFSLKLSFSVAVRDS